MSRQDGVAVRREPRVSQSLELTRIGETAAGRQAVLGAAGHRALGTAQRLGDTKGDKQLGSERRFNAAPPTRPVHGEDGVDASDNKPAYCARQRWRRLANVIAGEQGHVPAEIAAEPAACAAHGFGLTDVAAPVVVFGIDKNTTTASAGAAGARSKRLG
ncbi:MAG TPA: hypothetical protein VFR48_09440 [Solirubrobacteraceae bacterium]|nr:hypothetical protein [Solirubrobacteraceae bacterium]